MKAIREVRRQKEGNDAKRGYVVGDAQRRCDFEPDGRLACRAGRSGVAEYGPAHGDQVKGIPLRHLHDAVRADIDVPS